jgi:hypothetical protein
MTVSFDWSSFMRFRTLLPAYAYWIVFWTGAARAAIYIAWRARDEIRRLAAGPIRFRLPLASLARPWREGKRLTSTGAGFGLLAVVLLVSVRAPSPNSLADNVFSVLVGILLPAALLYGPSGGSEPRRQETPMRVLASGWLTLAIGAVALASGVLALRTSANPADHPAGPLLFIAVIAFLTGVAVLREYRIGTLVREGGIEIFGGFVPWSRVAVEDWSPREGGFVLTLLIHSPRRLFGMQVMPDSELIVPVPAVERPAIEAFLAEHATAAVRGLHEPRSPRGM